MLFQDKTAADGTIEECLDEINDFVATLGRYPPKTLAIALRIHLETLLGTLLERSVYTRQEIRAFAKDLQHEALRDGSG